MSSNTEHRRAQSVWEWGTPLQFLVWWEQWKDNKEGGADHFVHSDVKKHALSLRIKFYLGQNEDCSPEYCTSDSSEKLLPREGGGGQCIHDLGEGGVHTVKHMFFQKASASLVKRSASHEERLSP